MILVLNIGNSNITFGGYMADGKLVFSSRLFADTALSSDELLYKMVNMLALYGAEPQQITGVIFSSVVPGADAAAAGCPAQNVRVPDYGGRPRAEKRRAHPDGQPDPAGRGSSFAPSWARCSTARPLRGGKL